MKDMRMQLGDELRAKLARVLEERLGLYFPIQRWPDMERGLAAAAAELGCDSVEDCAAQLIEAPLNDGDIEILAAHLTVGETYFFRDQPVFRALEDRVLPDLIAERRNAGRRYLRLWSAGCCTGEEPYSIAILLARLLPDLAKWDVTLRATDINRHFLVKAVRGEYSAWSFREAPEGLQKRYFDQTDERHYRIRERFRKMVTFGVLNLAENVHPSPLNNTNAMDVIFCRNVLMYFAPQHAENAVARLCRSLVNGGWLAVSPAEGEQVAAAGFERVDVCGTTLFRKQADLVEAAPAASLPRAAPMPPPQPAAPPPEKVRVEGNPLDEAKALYSGGRYAEAAEKLRSLADGNAPAALLLARCCANEARLDDALAWCDRAIEADKLDPASHFLRAAILQEKPAPDEAVAALKRALYLDPRFVMAHFAIATLLRKQGRVKEADRHFQNAAELATQAAPGAALPASEGLTADRLLTLISALRSTEIPA